MQVRVPLRGGVGTDQVCMAQSQGAASDPPPPLLGSLIVGKMPPRRMDANEFFETTMLSLEPSGKMSDGTHGSSFDVSEERLVHFKNFVQLSCSAAHDADCSEVEALTRTACAVGHHFMLGVGARPSSALHLRCKSTPC